jgi:hypothetical protein
MTILIPLVAILGAVALSEVNLRWLTVAAAVVLSALGVVEIARRYRGEYVPSFTPVRTFALSVHPRTVLTNNPLVLYYLRDLHPRFDRPADLGVGLAGSCARPCLIIDFAQGSGGTRRRVVGAQRLIPPYLVTLEN